jgi:hypothetical protein
MGGGLAADRGDVSAIRKYEAHIDWATVIPVGDTLSVLTAGRVDDRWAKAFEVVLHEHQHRTAPREWGRIDFEYAAGEREPHLVIYVRAIKPEARSVDLRRTLDGVVSVANSVAQVGPHVYELARELREPPGVNASKESTPPPPALQADAA